LPIEIAYEEKEVKLPFTHIDSVRLSHRDGEEMDSWIRITLTAKGDINHQVRFSQQEALSRNLTQQLLRAASKLSGALVSQNATEVFNGHQREN
jgi:hypothetical protein